mgnify:FL=1
MNHPENNQLAVQKLTKKLQKETGKAVVDFNMIEHNDKVMVCLSGGKDSYTLLDMLLHLQKVAPISFSIVAVNLDQKQPGFPAHILPEYLIQKGVDFQIVEEDTYSIVTDKVPEGKTTCGLCSRLRRAILYKTAKAIGATKIALGHHRDDMLETLMLNMFYGGKLKAMPPKLISDNGEHIVIRPLAYCNEADIAKFAQQAGYPIIPCNLCGSQENLQRQNIKMLLQDWEQRFPGRIQSMATALQNVVPSHLADSEIYGFADLQVTGEQNIDGDIAFDPITPTMDAMPRQHVTEVQTIQLGNK